MTDTPDDISDLPLTQEDVKMALDGPMAEIVRFMFQSHRLIPAELRESLDALDEAINDVQMAIEDMS